MLYNLKDKKIIALPSKHVMKDGEREMCVLDMVMLSLYVEQQGVNPSPETKLARHRVGTKLMNYEASQNVDVELSAEEVTVIKSAADVLKTSVYGQVIEFFESAKG